MMNDEIMLGKISKIKFGKDDGRFGLWITLSGPWSVMSQYTCWDPEEIKITEYTHWNETDRDDQMIKIMRKVSELLNNAKVSNITELKNIPVEITLKNGKLDTWRILTEVL